MTTLVVIQARLNSHRLPGKALLDLCGQPVIQRVVERAKAIPGVERVVVACPIHDLEAFGEQRLGVPIFGLHGDEHDVLHRFLGAALCNGADRIVRVTGDCTFLAPDLAGLVLSLLAPVPAGWVACACSRHDGNGSQAWPDGMDVEAFTMEALTRADHAATDPLDREHVTRWMYRQPGDERGGVSGPICPPACPVEWPACKLSIDTQADLDFARRVMARISEGDYGWRATLAAAREETSA